jgi:threonine dehydrogenase-like Zn-dependent dehydrogenase
MRAVVCEKRGVMKLEEIEQPAVPDDGVLVRVHASSVNPVDLFPLSVAGRLIRKLTRKPARDVMGTDFAGTVQSVGKDVTRFRPGDEVFGGEHGSFTEYICLSESQALALKPSNVSFEQAGCVAVAALTALQAMRDHGQVKPGQKVLINGASGGVGTFAVQIARALGAEVTAVCSPRNLDTVRSLGAQRVIDYTREPLPVGVQAGPPTQRHLRVGGCGRGPAHERDEGIRSFHRHTPALDARHAEIGVLHRQADSKGHGGHRRAHGEREGDACHRQVLRARSGRRSIRLFQRWPLEGKDRARADSA